MRFLITFLTLTIAVTVSSQPTETTDYLAEGKKAANEKNYTLAVEHLKKATTQKPTDGEAWYELGWCYNELSKYDEAVKALSNAKNYLKDQAKVFFESGYANDYTNKTEDAINDYKRCLELNQNYSGAYKQLGNIYYDLKKDHKTALEYYNKYVNYSLESEISAKTWYKKGFCENETEQYEDAILSLKKAVNLDNKYAAAYDELGYACYKSGKADEAIDAYTTSKNLDPKSSASSSGLGDVYRYLKKNIEEAFKHYLNGVAINPNSQNSNFGAGWCNNEKGNYEAAIPYLKKAVEINNKYAVAFTELGYAYYALKKYDEALTELSKSVSLVNSGAPNYYMGLCYIAKNQKAKAQEIYQKLTSLNSPDANKLLAKINAMQ